MGKSPLDGGGSLSAKVHVYPPFRGKRAGVYTMAWNIGYPISQAPIRGDRCEFMEISPAGHRTRDCEVPRVTQEEFVCGPEGAGRGQFLSCVA